MRCDPAAGQPEVTAVIVDFGGVMTQPVTEMFKHFADVVGLSREQSRAVIGAVYRGGAAGDGAIQQLERGAITPEDLEVDLAAAVGAVTGRQVPAAGLFAQLWGALRLDPLMVAGIGRLRRSGVATALLSNSWGADNYPFADLEGVVDAWVISGEVGIRKPDEAIYALALERVGRTPGECAFVDDLAANVDVAVGLGMQGIHHRTAEDTLARLSQLCRLPPDLTG